MALIQVDFSQVAPDAGRAGPIPADWYILAMEKSENKPTKDGNGNTYLECVFGVVEGQFKGRKVYHRFNLNNSSQQAKEIAFGQMSALCHAVNHLQVNDSSELHGRAFKGRVKVTPAQGEYEASNEITSFKNVNDASAVDAVKANQAAAQGFKPPAGMAPPVQSGQPPQGWAQPGQQPQQLTQQFVQPQPGQQPQQFQPQVQQPQQYAPQPQQGVQQPGVQGGQPPQWQPPAGAQPQPWAQPVQPQPGQQQPQAQQPVQPAQMAQPQWSPPPAGQPAAGGTPPWMQTGQPPQQ